MLSANATAHVGGDLRASRKHAGLSQQRVAELAECSVSYVRLLEAGYCPGQHSDVLARITNVLNDESAPPANGTLSETSGAGTPRSRAG